MLFAAALLLVASCSGDDDDASDATSTTTTSASSTSADSDDTTTTGAPGTTDTTGASTGIASNTLPPVAVGTPAELAGNFVVIVTSIEPTTFATEGPGQTAGPGVIVKIEVRNDANAPIDLAGIAVNAHYGENVPAPPSGPSDATLSGTVAPGARATGEYGFRVPEDQRGSVVVDIQHSAAPNVVLVNAAQ
ncbi:MAG: hypothetical protein ACRDV7_01860 [Acidimicrobiia bacterium]